MLNLDGFVKLTENEVIWLTDKDGEPFWKPKIEEPGKSYCLVISKVASVSFSSKPLSYSLRGDRK